MRVSLKRVFGRGALDMSVLAILFLNAVFHPDFVFGCRVTLGLHSQACETNNNAAAAADGQCV